MPERYAFLTVDTEALPNRAEDDHVNRLIIGKHGAHQAGVYEMASIAAEAGASMVFFLDLCGAWDRADELRQVAQTLVAKGQDVQLHAHPEYLPQTFWQEHKLNKRPYYLNDYPLDRADFMLGLLSKKLEEFTGQKPCAFRAGSFRWNSNTLKALQKYGFKYSFNNSMCAVFNKQCPFSLPVNTPYQWSNGLMEFPVSEKQIFSFIDPSWWARLQYPQSRYFRFRSGLARILPGSMGQEVNPAVFLIHSWSFLHRDKAGYEIYENDRIMEKFRAFTRQLARECDIITTRDLPDLIAKNKITFSHVEDIDHAAMPAK